jgi:hypothetical protein
MSILARLVGADRHHLALLQSGQQFGLEVEREVADLVQEERAAVGCLHAADAVALGVGEGALHVPEQLGIEQAFGDGAEIHRDQLLARPARAAVEFACDQFLAGAVLAEDQDVGISRPRALDQRIDAGHCGGAAEQRAGAGSGRLAGRGGGGLAGAGRRHARIAQGRGVAHGGQQPLVGPGLGHEVGRAALHRLDRHLTRRHER